MVRRTSACLLPIASFKLAWGRLGGGSIGATVAAEPVGKRRCAGPCGLKDRPPTCGALGTTLLRRSGTFAPTGTIEQVGQPIRSVGLTVVIIGLGADIGEDNDARSREGVPSRSGPCGLWRCRGPETGIRTTARRLLCVFAFGTWLRDVVVSLAERAAGTSAG